jgi:hypothetical protein
MMTSLLVDHPLGYTWENYGEIWGTDHIWPYDNLNRKKVWHRFKLNNFINLQPLKSKDNSDKNNDWQLQKQARKKQKKN